MRKTIWSFWEGKTNSLNTKCFKSWKKYASDWEIIILDLNKIKKYNIKKPDNFDKLSNTIKSDVIRLNLLYNYGGLWLDASVLLTENLNWIYKYEDYPIIAFKKNKRYIENWFIVAFHEKLKIIELWLDTFIDILNTKPYTKHIAYKKKCTTNDNYFMCYQAWCYLKSSNNYFKNTVKDIPFINLNILKHFFNPLIKFENHEKLIKFIKSSRESYPIFKFPYIYIYIFIFVVIIVTVTVICVIRKKHRNNLN